MESGTRTRNVTRPSKRTVCFVATLLFLSTNKIRFRTAVKNRPASELSRTARFACAPAATASSPLPPPLHSSIGVQISASNVVQSDQRACRYVALQERSANQSSWNRPSRGFRRLCLASWNEATASLIHTFEIFHWPIPFPRRFLPPLFPLFCSDTARSTAYAENNARDPTRINRFLRDITFIPPAFPRLLAPRSFLFSSSNEIPLSLNLDKSLANVRVLRLHDYRSSSRAPEA